MTTILAEFFTSPVNETVYTMLLAGLLFLLSGLLAAMISRYVYVKIKVTYHKQIRNTFKSEIDNKAAQEHIRNIARNYKVSRKRAKFDFIKEINKQLFSELKQMKRDLSSMPVHIITLVPSAKWLFDNYYLIYKELSAIWKTVNYKNIREFPVVDNGVMKGYFRIYLIANEIMACSLNHLNEESIVSLLKAYQMEIPLTSAELWAFPTILKGCLMESILDASESIISNIRTKVEADILMSRMTAQLRESNKTIVELLKENIPKGKIENYSYISHILYFLKNVSADETEIRNWLIEELDLDIDKSEHQNIVAEIIHKEKNLEAISRNAISSLIVSLKEISELNWEDLFETVSPIEEILQKDPKAVYQSMDFHTRDLYRHQIEKVAKILKSEESKIAKRAYYLALSASDESNKVHIGVFILGKEKEKLYDGLTDGRLFLHKCGSILHKKRGFLYFASLILLFLAACFTLTAGLLSIDPVVDSWIQAVLMILMVIPVSGIFIEILNNITTALIPPAEVLSMDFSKGIPDRNRTFVVIPVILGSRKQVQDYADKLERYYLGNMQSNLFFAILGDFKDAQTEEIPEDLDIAGFAKKTIADLNHKYPNENLRFNLFIRFRKYNESEACWMGWERKRGKLEEFNALLLGETGTSYDVAICSKKMLGTFRYVITLDADTELIRESAEKLVGIMAHPLNRPVWNTQKTKIVEGYSIVQSEIRNRLSSVKYSIFSNLFANNPGIDTYSTLVSDVYYDTFNEGIFFGKGIYDIKIFHRLFHGNLPENSVLSHDLLESCYARCAFASGVKLMDKYPSGLASYSKREHRWTRGDWQLLPWLFRRSPIGGLSRWKMFDNIRRSLMNVSWLLLIFANLILLPQKPFLWMLFVFFSPAMQFVLSFRVIIEKLKHPESSLAFKNIFANLFKILLQGVLIFVLIPHRAYTSMDAIIRTLYRILFSHKKLLQWDTAEDVETGFRNTLHDNLLLMAQSIITGVLLLMTLPFSDTSSGKISIAVVSLLWWTGPLVAYLISRPSPSVRKRIFLEDELKMLRRHACKIWYYFEEHATEETNWLCPDNIQIFPVKKVTLKTSPTNIGLQLMSVLAARDMGYISMTALINTCEKIIGTIRVMEKWQGHLYNWYDIKTLKTLSLKYISTVDSGNFIVYLVTLKNALINTLDLPITAKSRFKGLQDILLLSGLDYKMNTEDFTTEGWKRTLNEIIALTGENQKYWEHQKWVDRLRKTCAGLLAETDEYIQSQPIPSTGSSAGDIAVSTLQAATGSIVSLAEAGNSKAADLASRIRILIGQIDQMIRSTDFKVLYDQKQGLFTIGYNPETQRPDFSKYDLLASEARQASFIAIAKGDVPQKHWFKLGRPLTIVNHMQALVSWSGSMFEYLMPELVIKSVPNSMIYQSCVAMVTDQIRYARKKNVPWGISEAQYYRFDTDSNYQYRAFGVSDLSFQSIMQSDLVIAPYATMLALSIMPKETIENMKLLISLGAEDEYGFFESIDFTVPDTSQHKRYSMIRSYMAHHQGMSLMSIDNALNSNIMQKRFHQEPMVQATEVLLEEYNPSNLFTLNNNEYNLKINPVAYSQNSYECRTYHNPSLTYPSAHVLCNDHYMLMLTTGGGGFSKCDDFMISRWRSDIACNLYGTFFYVKDVTAKKVFGTTYYPLITEPDEYEAIFSIDKVEYIRKDGVVKTHAEITLSPIDNIEVRRLTFHNGGNEEKELEITSYLELVNDTYESDLAHPAFSKMFNEIEYVQGSSMLVGKRRAREKDEKGRYVIHFVLYNGKYYKAVEFETDRKRFIGRGNTLLNPDAMNSNLSLSNLGGQTTDPIMSLRAAIKIGAGKSATVSYLTGFCQTWEEVVELHHKYGISYNLNDIFELAHVDSELELFYLNISSHQFNIIQDIVGTIYYPSNLFRTSEDVIKRNKANQTGLWRFGISGDHPVILLRISDIEDIRAAKDVIIAYEFFKKNLIDVDLVLLNEQISGYTNDLTGMLLDLTSNLRMYEENPLKRSLFILHAYLMAPEEIDLLLTASRLVINAKTGFSYWFAKELLLDKSKSDKNILPYYPKQNQSMSTAPLKAENTNPAIIAAPKSLKAIKFHEGTLEFNNNIGGFVNYGEEYEIRLCEGQKTPMPWINVIANDHFGFHISESGSGYTWAVNSHENKLTAWSNDPVSDPPSEIIYFRDEETGEYSTPTCGPINDQGIYKIRHGHGFSVFEHRSMDLKQRMTVYATADDPVKIWHIKLKNESSSIRRISVILYLEWVLGISREKTTPYIVTEMDEEANLMTAHNVYSINFSHHYTFVSASEKISSFTGNRTEFIGAKGSFANPDAFRLKEFSNNTGAGYDPCSVLKINIEVEPDETKEVVFVLGQTAHLDNVRRLVLKHCNLENAKYELGKVKAGWKSLLGQIKINTPDRALNILVNEWLLYQVISCRLRSRAAFYQCGGAYGFRDQLQDVLALLHTDPARAEMQILLCCSRQFPEGDVQHWWHPHNGQGIRTKMSDDLLWLPYVTALYISSTGDYSILGKKADYLTGPLLKDDEVESYFVPGTAGNPGSVYRHCIKAIEKSLNRGEHGLPLMGSGDWNDGMNRVGAKGTGESVWLGWFLISVLKVFSPLCVYKNEEARSKKYLAEAAELASNIEENAWDGEWYLRAYFDNGEPLGSQKNEECKIDSISQSWGILSGAAESGRSIVAVRSADKHLVKEEDGVICLLTPPFDVAPMDPGYIKGYYPGVRENGGQYTHAAVWLAMAHARLRDGDGAYKLFSMMNPINISATYKDAMKYEQEPYVLAGDIYSKEPNSGKGGWSWYTGSAGWMYQALISDLLGIRRKGTSLSVDPSIPGDWGEYTVEYFFGAAKYTIHVVSPGHLNSGCSSLLLDDIRQPANSFELADDGKEHTVTARLGPEL